jgi:hypothetical protein
MSDDFLFVSCDIVGNSIEPDVGAQLRHVTGINDVVRGTLKAANLTRAQWFSGGDGGHVALLGDGAPLAAINLIIALRTWSMDARVPLRVVGCAGPATSFTGADGRTDMVGPGLNMAARLLQQSGADGRIVVTDEFRERCAAVAQEAYRFHDPRTLRGPFPSPLPVWLFSVRNRFDSLWNAGMAGGPASDLDDRQELERALNHKDGLTVLYRAKRLLQVNAADGDAIGALRAFMGAEASRIGPSRMLTQLFADVSLGQEIVRAAALVERDRGETLFRAGDEGQKMFLILRGRLAGYLPSSEEKAAADFELGPGEIVGEMAFALKTRRNATLVCTEDCSLLAFSQQELFAAANTSPLLPQVKQAVDSIVRTRILQNVCRAATYLSGDDRRGPLGRVERPWEDLRAYSRTISVSWQERDIRFDAPAFRDPGLYLLAGGKVELPDGTVLQPQGQDPPILAADLPGEVRYRPESLRLLDDVTVLFIGSSGFDQFGRTAHDRLAAEVRARTTKATPAAPRSSAPATAVEGLLRVGGDSQGSRGADIIFVHGLDGDARSTWQNKENSSLFWPAWLAEDVPGATVWSLGYEVSSSAWRGSSMPLSDRATNALATLETQGLGERPIVFICHSLGGLLVKQMLRHALDFGVAAWRNIAERTAGIVFLSTPHSGSDISNWMKHIGVLLRLTVSVDELKAHDPRLRELNTWFRNSPLAPAMRIQVYCEKLPVGAGILVVNETSADPGLQGVIPIPVDEDHVSICKPETREKLVYSRVKRFVTDVVRSAG